MKVDTKESVRDMTVNLSQSNKRKHHDKETLFIILIQQRPFYKTKNWINAEQ